MSGAPRERGSAEPVLSPRSRRASHLILKGDAGRKPGSPSRSTAERSQTGWETKLEWAFHGAGASVATIQESLRRWLPSAPSADRACISRHDSGELEAGRSRWPRIPAWDASVATIQESLRRGSMLGGLTTTVASVATIQESLRRLIAVPTFVPGRGISRHDSGELEAAHRRRWVAEALRHQSPRFRRA